MRKKLLVTFMCTCAIAVSAAGCGGGSGSNGSSEAAQSAEAEAGTETEEDGGAAEGDGAAQSGEDAVNGSTAAAAGSTAETAEASSVTRTASQESFSGEKYWNEAGWSARYDSDLVEVNEYEDSTEFVYAGDCDGTNKLVVSYIPNTVTDIVLADELSYYDDERIERSEGYFAGRADIWAFYADVIREGWRTTLGYTAVEHNGGVLLIERDGYLDSDEATAARITETMQNILGSFELDDHRRQVEYDYIPGTYVLKVENEEEPLENYTSTIVLREDHTGQITIQDTVDILWFSRDGIIKEDYEGGETYFFNMEGETLYLEQGDGWAEYHKEEEAEELVSLEAADKDFDTFVTYENEEGWLVYYDTRLFTVVDKGEDAEFVYTGSGSTDNRLEFIYYWDDSTEDIIEDREDDYDETQIVRTEGYLGGGRDAWSFTSTVSEGGLTRTYTAVEHNGGVLLVQRVTSDADEEVAQAYENLVSIFLFTRQDNQIEYEDVPGRFELNDKALQKDASNYPRYIVLRQDHSGTMGNTAIVWHARDGLLQEEIPDGATYNYDREDDSLYVGFDGEWVEFVEMEEDD